MTNELIYEQSQKQGKNTNILEKTVQKSKLCAGNGILLARNTISLSGILVTALDLRVPTS